ncbi:MAG: hypothetical protein QOE63_1739 [Acidimicrobiaceae bacterium]
MDAVNQQMLTDTLRALARAQKLFGGDTSPVDPPVFAAARDLEDGLGRGTFRETA